MAPITDVGDCVETVLHGNLLRVGMMRGKWRLALPTPCCVNQSVRSYAGGRGSSPVRCANTFSIA